MATALWRRAMHLHLHMHMHTYTRRYLHMRLRGMTTPRPPSQRLCSVLWTGGNVTPIVWRESVHCRVHTLW